MSATRQIMLPYARFRLIGCS